VRGQPGDHERRDEAEVEQQGGDVCIGLLQLHLPQPAGHLPVCPRSGVSKGGETAIFHDYYYPNDFAGTFAWSAPSITHTFSRTYDNFLASVGTPACRTALIGGFH
jgi:hypothetical protein